MFRDTSISAKTTTSNEPGKCECLILGKIIAKNGYAVAEIVYGNMTKWGGEGGPLWPLQQ